MSAVLFGSISTVVDTSELQRESFNRAFESHGLDWHWDREEYLGLLEKSGGAGRIEEYAEARGQEVDAAAVHETKSSLFQEALASSGASARPGVVETIRGARDRGLKVGLVTTTSRDNVSALLAAVGPDLGADDFDVVVDSTSVDRPKPDAAAYTFALGALGEDGDHCVAIEDNLGGVDAALAAGVTCVAFPNENTDGHDFGRAHHVVHRLELDELTSAVPSA